jgi:glycerol-3-phosphate dehydrogenase
LRYLFQGNVALTRASVKEREHLLSDGRGLIEPLDFLIAVYQGDAPGRWSYKLGLTIHDCLVLRRTHRYHKAPNALSLVPNIATKGLRGFFQYRETVTDDARLVLRIIKEGVRDGGTALNYAAAEGLLRRKGRVAGLQLQDMTQDRSGDVRSNAVINATGVWADRLRSGPGGRTRLRPLRGSHLVFSNSRLPVDKAVAFQHPCDRRHVFVMPWEGVTLLGTTDLDHDQSLEVEPRITPTEVDYLMTAGKALFPSLGLKVDDVLCTFSGVRPVIGTGKADPSKESREHAIWQEEGLLTVTGGKLTTFRLIARDAMKALQRQWSRPLPPIRPEPALNPFNERLTGGERLTDMARRRLRGLYGAELPALLAAAQPGELEPIAGTSLLWAELRWAARSEAVVHLEDLLLRRVCLGLLLPRGGEALLPQIRSICEPELDWSDARWMAEEAAYRALWRQCYSLPPASDSLEQPCV